MNSNHDNAILELIAEINIKFQEIIPDFDEHKQARLDIVNTASPAFAKTIIVSEDQFTPVTLISENFITFNNVVKTEAGIPKIGIDFINFINSKSNEIYTKYFANLPPSSLTMVYGKSNVVTIGNIEAIDKPNSVRLYEQDPILWENALKEFLRTSMLPMSTSDPEIIELYLSDEVMDIWKRSFTHKSWNPNPDGNYEQLEKEGDKVMGLTFNDYLITVFPNINEDQITNVQNKYLAKKHQAEMGEAFELDKYVLTRYKVNISVYEDLYEAYFGALYKIGEDFIGPGKGLTMCKYITYTIYSRMNVDINEGRPVITHVKEILEALEWIDIGMTKDVEVKNDDGFFIVMTDAGKKFSNEFLDMPITSDQVAIGSGNNKRIAYANALNWLLERGLNDEAIEALKKRKVRDELGDDYISSLTKAKALGYIDLIFSKPTKTDQDRSIQLIGIRPDGKKEILTTVRGDPTVNNYQLRKTALDRSNI